MNKTLTSLFLLFSLSLTFAQPVFVSTTGAGAEVQSIPPSFEEYSVEDIILASVGKEIFSKTTAENLTQYCSQQGGVDKIVDETERILDAVGYDYTSVCGSLEGGLRDGEVGDDWCETSRKEKSATCPPDEEKLVQQCKNRLEKEKHFRDVEEDDFFWCENEFRRNRAEMDAFCRNGEIRFEGRCPKFPEAGEWEKECRDKGGKPWRERTPDGCEFPRCDFDTNRPPIIIDPKICPPVPHGWDEMCRRTGGWPSSEKRGRCEVPRCDFDDDVGRRICPAIAIPPNWQDECRKSGGIPIPDDPYGCPRAECRKPNVCPPLPAAPAGALCPLNEVETVGIDPAGCKYFYCRKTGEIEKPITPCPEVSSYWYDECRRSGGTPDAKPDPARPACLQFFCSGGGQVQTCPAEATNAENARQCIARGGSVYYSYGQGNCQIVACDENRRQVCPQDVFTDSQAQQCQQAGGTVSTSYSNGCSYRYCYYAPITTCPAAPVCSGNQVPRVSSYSGTCPVYTCQASSCPAPPTCYVGSPVPDGVDSQGCTRYSCSSTVNTCSGAYKCTDGSYAVPTGYNAPGQTCPTYQCSSTQVSTCPTPPACTSDRTLTMIGSGINSACPMYSCEPSVCPQPHICPDGSRAVAGGGVTHVGNAACYIYQCSGTGTNVTTTPPGGCTPITAPSCPAGQYARPTYVGTTACISTYTCTPNDSGSNATWTGGGGQCPPAPTCPAGQYSYAGSMASGSGSCPAYNCVPSSCYCPASTPPASLNCPTGQVAAWTDSPYTCSGGTVIQCSTNQCKTLPRCSSGCGSSSQTTCSSGMVLKTSQYSTTMGGQQCYCDSSWCETDYSSLPTCAAATCPSSTCSGQIRRTSGGYTTYYENGQQCKCESAWCETDPSQCASATCPSYPPCSAEQTQRATGSYQYTPPGCSTTITCQSYSCETTSANASASRVTGLATAGDGRSSEATTSPAVPSTVSIGAVPSPAVASETAPPVPAGVRSICTPSGKVSRDAVISQCLAYRRAYAYSSYAEKNIEEICRDEVRRTLPEIKQFCDEGKDPYKECKQRSKSIKAKYGESYVQCKKLANKYDVLNLVRRKAEIECKRRAYDITLLSNATSELTEAEQAHAELVQDKIVLTKADIDKLKEEIRRDVLQQVQADLARLFGARAEQDKAEAQRKIELATRLEETAVLAREVCSKAGDEECFAAQKIELQAKELRKEANYQLTSAGGIIAIISNILSGK